MAFPGFGDPPGRFWAVCATAAAPERCCCRTRMLGSLDPLTIGTLSGQSNLLSSNLKESMRYALWETYRARLERSTGYQNPPCKLRSKSCRRRHLYRARRKGGPQV